MHALLNVAVMAARRAGAVFGRNFNKRDKLTVEKKGHNDFVSSADLAAEKRHHRRHPQALSGSRHSG